MSSGQESVLTPDLLGLLCAAPDTPPESVGPRLPPQGLSTQASSQTWIPPEHTRDIPSKCKKNRGSFLLAIFLQSMPCVHGEEKKVGRHGKVATA